MNSSVALSIIHISANNNTMWFQNLFITTKGNFKLIKYHSPNSLATTNPPSVSMDMPILDISHKFTVKQYLVLCLASFT